MIQISFNYEANIFDIQSNLEEKMMVSVMKFITKADLNLEDVYFLYNGGYLELEKTVDNIINKDNRADKKMSILVNLLNFENKTTKNNFVISKIPICPTCKSNSRMIMKEYKILLLKCKNMHKSNNLFLGDYEETQKIDESKIICENENCVKKGNKNDSYNNIFFICLTCKKNLCPMCRKSHANNHNIINYDHKYYICQKHNNPYISYCENCLENMCMICEPEHKSHKIIHFSKFLPKNEDLIKKINEIRDLIDKFKQNIIEVTKKEIFDKVIENLESYYKIYNNIINNYDINFLNYEILYNLNEFLRDNSIINDLNYIINKDNKEEKNSKINNIYKKLCTNEIEEMTIIYNAIYRNDRSFFRNLPINKNKRKKFKENELMLFSSEFVEKNKDKCKIIYEEKEYELVDIFKHETINDDTKIIKFILKGINNIVDISNIFCESNELISLPDILFLNTSKITNLSRIFKGCTNLNNLSDISIWDTSNVTNMDSMFCGCSSLKALPDISNWNISNVTNLNGIFSKCSSLESLPDISKWNTSNVTDMSGIFESCEITSLPDISKWDTSKVKDISKIFNNCYELKSLPDISNWNTSNIMNISELFSGCNNLESLPDITKWDNKKFNTIFALFSNCEKVSSLPDISNFDYH